MGVVQVWAAAPSPAHASSGSRPAPEACFQVVNSAGDAHGNCGQQSDSSFVPCAQRWGAEGGEAGEEGMEKLHAV